MVKTFLFAFNLMLFGCAASPYFTTDQNRPEPSLRIKSLKVMHTGVYSGDIAADETPSLCHDFVLTKAEVLNFFKTARSATLREYEHDLIASNCYISGLFESEGGVKGAWKIDRARRGLLLFSDGASKYYFCGECENKLFYESCDVDCIHSP